MTVLEKHKSRWDRRDGGAVFDRMVSRDMTFEWNDNKELTI